MSDSDEPETVSIPTAPAPQKDKVRLPRTEAQKAATQRGLEALARRRAEMLAAKATAPVEKPKRQVVKPDPEYFSPEMMEKAKNLVKAEMAKHAPKAEVSEPPPKAPVPPIKVAAAKTKPKRKARMIVVQDSSEEEEPVYIRRPKAAPQTLTGSDLLDQIFFNRR